MLASYYDIRLLCMLQAAVLWQVEVSLQPWRAFRPDGVILFSDILTPLTGMNIPFDIEDNKGPVIFDPIRTMQVRLSISRKPLDFCKWLFLL